MRNKTSCHSFTLAVLYIYLDENRVKILSASSNWEEIMGRTYNYFGLTIKRKIYYLITYGKK